jgi:hypothetical protein
VRPLLVVALDEAIELRLLLQEVSRRRLGRLLLECQMHPLVAAVLLGVTWLDALDADTQSQPPHRELAQAEEGAVTREGVPLSVRIARGKPKYLKARSNTVNAYASFVLAKASQHSRYRLAKSVIVSG